MADRTVKVTLVAQATGYIAGMEQAARKTRELGSEAERLAQKRAAFNDLGRSLLAVGVAAAIAVGAMVAKFAEFDRAMSQVHAVTQETTEGMHLLREAALEAGGATVFTATEAANAIEELGKNGLTTADILSGALDAALGLAAAGSLEVARAAEIAAITAKQFNLTGSELPHVADLLAAGAGKAAGDVEDLAQALSQAGLVSNQTGLSIEEATGTLAAFADAGLLGSDAGTSLRTMLLRLTPLSGEASDRMRELGVNAFNAAGEFVGMTQFAGILQAKLGTLTQEQRNLALTQIFGQDAIRGANLLYDLGADGLQRYIDQTNDAGYAAKVAADRLDNLSGDVEKLGGAFDTAFIKTGSGANEILRSFVQTATFLVDAVGDLPEPVLQVGLALGAAAGAIALVGGGALVAVPKIAAFRAALDALTISGRTASLAVGTVTAALSVATLVIGKLLQRQAEYEAGVDSITDSLDRASGAVTDYTRELTLKGLEEDGALKAAEDLGLSLDLVSKAAMGSESALETLRGGYEDFYNQAGFFDRYVALDNWTKLEYAIEQSKSQLNDAEGSWARTDTAMGDVAGTSSDVADGFDDVFSAASQTTEGINALADSIEAFNEQQFRSDDALLNFKQSVVDLREAMGEDGFTGTLDLSTEAGIRNHRMLMGIAGDANEAAAEVLRLGGSQEEANARLEEGRAVLEEVGAAFGLSGDALQGFIDKYLSNPTDLIYEAALNGLPEAQTHIDTFVTSNSGRKIPISVELAALSFSVVRNGRAVTIDTTRLSGLDSASGYASGGYTGIGSKYQVAGVVHRNEFVSTSETLSKPANRVALEYMHAGGDMTRWLPGPQYMASSGGPVAGVPTLDGMRVTGRLDLGDGLIGIIDGRLEHQERNQTIDAWAGDL